MNGAADPLAAALDALEAHGCRPRRRGDHVDALCPAHDDHNPSLSVDYSRPAGKVLINCHYGCSPDDVVDALGLSWADLYDAKPEQDRVRKAEEVAAYDYVDEKGGVLFQKVRYFPKTFKIRRPDG